MPTAAPTCRFRPTPAWLVYVSLLVTAILFLSERRRWFAFNEHKGWTVLLAVACVGVVLLLMLAWLAAALIFRRRFQFGIRTLLVLTVAVALPFSWLGVEMKRAKEQKDTVAALLSSGCTVWHECDGQQFLPIWLAAIRSPGTPPEWPWLLRWFGEDFFYNVDQVDCEHSRRLECTDADFASIVSHLSKLPAFKVLKLQSSDLSNKGLSPLEDLGSLKSLSIMMDLDDEGLKHIAAIKHLETLNVRNSHVTDEGLSCLRGIADLRCLFFYSPDLTRRSVLTFASLPKLEEIYLYTDELTVADLQGIMRAKPNLKVGIYRPNRLRTRKTGGTSGSSLR